MQLHSAVLSPVDSLREYACDVVPVPEIGRPLRDAMAALYCASYDATDRQQFLHDLDDKDEALLLWHGERMVGFTTLKTYGREWRGQALRVLFSGDTVVDRDHWGQQALSFAWVRHLGRIKQRHPDERLVWFLLVKGHRTYRYLHVFARTFHPGQDAGRDDLRELTDWLAGDRFPGHYNAASGLVEFPRSRGHLRAELAVPRDDELGRPGVAYFLRRNPAYRSGHELACLCDIAEANMKPLTLRLFRQGLQGAHAC